MARSYPEARNGAPMWAQRGESITTPPPQDFDTPAMEGSMQQFLADNLGQYVVIEFLIGTQSVTRKAGVLYAVGTSVVTLYEEISQTFVTCDMFSIKFVTFYLPGRRPWQVNNPMFGQGSMGAPGQWTGGGLMPGMTGIQAPGFAPPMDMGDAGAGQWAPGQDFAAQGGCVGGNCGGGATSTWG